METFKSAGSNLIRMKKYNFMGFSNESEAGAVSLSLGKGIVEAELGPGKVIGVGKGKERYADKSDVESDTDEDDSEEEEDDDDDPKVSSTQSPQMFHDTEVRNLKEIGIGQFGKVLQGTIQGRNMKPVPVAVKVFHVPLSMIQGDSKDGTLALLKLGKLKHRNLVPILGHVFDNVNAKLACPVGCPRLLLQFYPEGNLITYLSSKEKPHDYAMMGKFTLDIIQAMEFLHSNGIVHGNLAARNVLIERCINYKTNKTHYNAKVSDYGFASLCPNSKVFNSGNVRWFPRELLGGMDKDVPLKFTFKSDVWMFGVLLWEMWAKGIPYGSSRFEKDVIKLVEMGLSPLSTHRPVGTPNHIVEVMENIFKVDPKDRPTFKMLNEWFVSFRNYNKEKGKDGAKANFGRVNNKNIKGQSSAPGKHGGRVVLPTPVMSRDRMVPRHRPGTSHSQPKLSVSKVNGSPASQPKRIGNNRFRFPFQGHGKPGSRSGSKLKISGKAANTVKLVPLEPPPQKVIPHGPPPPKLISHGPLPPKLIPLGPPPPYTPMLLPVPPQMKGPSSSYSVEDKMRLELEFRRQILMEEALVKQSEIDELQKQLEKIDIGGDCKPAAPPPPPYQTTANVGGAFGQCGVSKKHAGSSKKICCKLTSHQHN